MRCAKAHRLIGDFLDGTIGPDENARLREHLDFCSDCRGLLKDFQAIAENARDLPKHEPSQRAWTAILDGLRKAGSEQIEQPAAKPRWLEAFLFQGRAKYAWAAAALLVIVGVAVIGFKPRTSAPGLSDQGRFTLAKLEEAEKHYKLAIRALSDAIGSQKNGLDAQVAAVFDRNLKEIDTVIRACQDAVVKEPRNLDARTYLLSAYKDKVEFLDDVIETKKRSSPAKAETKI